MIAAIAEANRKLHCSEMERVFAPMWLNLLGIILGLCGSAEPIRNPSAERAGERSESENI
jgi:hypothetical protein